MPRRRRKIHKNRPQIQPQALDAPLTITRQAYGGRGVGHHNGMAVFVPRTAEGDIVDVQLLTQRRHYAIGEVTDLRRASAWRVQAPCVLYDRCGGCHLQHLGYAHQLAIKTDQVHECLSRIGKLSEVPVAPILGSARPFGYRNKILYHYDSTRGVLGLMDRQGHRILDTPRCLISDPQADVIMARIRALAAALPALRPILHQVQVQVGQRTGGCLVTIMVHAKPAVAIQQQLWKAIQDQARGLWLHVKTADTPARFKGDTILVAGEAGIYERVGDHLFRLEPQSFFQVNTRQMERLYDLVRKTARLQGDEVVLDLYSGGGSIAFMLAPYCRQVYGVEIDRQATLLAIQQAETMGIYNCAFRTGKVERILYRYLAQGIRPELAVLDPPRAGCHPEVLQALAKLQVPRVIYVSCSPPTLARDLRRLHDLGYQTSVVQPLDMFPHTYHIECVATLRRNGCVTT
jgi:23S rRNA (uracil1939-C5)-methyltransferase